MQGLHSLHPGSSFVEGLAPATAVTTNEAVLTFPSLAGFATGGQSGDGWIDVRGYSLLQVVAKITNVSDTAGSIRIESKRTMIDKITQLAPATAVADTITDVLADEDISGIAYIRIYVTGGLAAPNGGTMDVSFLAE